MAEGEGPAIACRGAEKIYASPAGEVVALRALDLEVRAGESLAITGPSGCGKTTLLNILGALDRPSGGSIKVFGRELSALDARGRARYRREDVGFIFQHFHLIPTLTALENVALPLRYAGAPRRQRLARARGALERVGLAARLDHRPALLSGGEQQRVAVARALAGGARLLLADEPTGNLDGATAAEVVALLKQSLDGCLTLVIVTHDPEIAACMGRRLSLRDGRAEAETRGESMEKRE